MTFSECRCGDAQHGLKIISVIMIGAVLLTALPAQRAIADDTAGKASGQSFATEKRSTFDGILQQSVDDAIVPGFESNSPSAADYNEDSLTNADTLEVHDIGEQARAILQAQPYRDLTEGELEELENTLNTQNDPESLESLAQFLSNTYEDCSAVQTPSSQAELKYCDGWKADETETCVVERELLETADFVWRCKKDNLKTVIQCTQTLSKSCSASYESQDPTKLSDEITSSGDLPFTINRTGTFSVGTSSIIWGCPGCQFEHRGFVTLDLEGVDLITKFNLISVDWDDYVKIIVNGKRVWGTSTAFVAPLRETGRIHHSTPNLDITPYLVEGRNTIEVRVWVVRDGWLYVVFDTALNLCTDYTETWSETCPE